MTADPAIPQVPAAKRPLDRAAQAFALVDAWLSAGPMAELLGLLDGPDDRDGWPHPHENLPDWLDAPLGEVNASVDGLSAGQAEILRRTMAIERSAAVRFNFRTRDGGRYLERWQAVGADFSPQVRAEVLRHTDALGLVSPRSPRLGDYDGSLVLGGGYRSPLLRARYAAELRAAGTTLGEVGFLGSPRFLIEEPPERPMTEPYAPGATDEFDLMLGAARTELALEPAEVTFLCGCPSAERQCPNWPARGLDRADETPPAFTHERRADLVGADGRTVGAVFSASSGRPPLRPDTADTLSLWARYAHPRLGQRVLVVTTQVFVPFQAFDGIRRLYLPYGVDVDTVGFGAQWSDRPPTAEYLLQETLSAIRSARRLLVDATEVLTGDGSPT